MGCLVEARDLWKVYRGGVEAVRGFTGSFGPGRTAIMGPNGSGKSTLLAMLAGVLKPSRGRVLVCGHDPWGRGWAEARSLTGYAPQDPPLPRAVTALEALTVLGGLMGLPLGEARREASLVMEELGLSGLAGVKVTRLSGGQRRRLGVAAALMGSPEVVLLDEPSSGLDPAARARLWRALGRLASGATIVFTTHDPVEAEEEAGEVVVMHRGRALARGSPRELIERYAPRPRVRVWGSGVPRGLKPRRLLGDGAAEFEVESERGVAEVVSAYAAEGVTVYRVEVARPGLREVFLELAGEELEG